MALLHIRNWFWENLPSFLPLSSESLLLSPVFPPPLPLSISRSPIFIPFFCFHQLLWLLCAMSFLLCTPLFLSPHLPLLLITLSIYPSLPHHSHVQLLRLSLSLFLSSNSSISLPVTLSVRFISKHTCFNGYELISDVAYDIWWWQLTAMLCDRLPKQWIFTSRPKYPWWMPHPITGARTDRRSVGIALSGFDSHGHFNSSYIQYSKDGVRDCLNVLVMVYTCSTLERLLKGEAKHNIL